MWKKLLKRTFLYLVWKVNGRWDFMRWQLSGRQGQPPHLAKEHAVLQYASRYGCSILVETGTYLGDMVAAAKRHFTRIYSIELDPELYNQAVRRFARWPHILILPGDSAQVLSDLVNRLTGPTLFWLDGHFSQGITARGPIDTPIVQELEAILGS